MKLYENHGLPSTSRLKRTLLSTLNPIAFILAVLACAGLSASAAEPLGLSPVPVPKDNPQTPEKIHLGKQLYFDKRLSKDDTVSCASCHDPKFGFSNGERFATGVGGAKGGRSAPSVINSAYYRQQFWDGRAASLEEQALGPIANPIEMALPIEDAVAKLNRINGYKTSFQKVFGTDVTADGIAKAIAAYERTVISGNAPYDRFKAGDKSALSEAAQRGMKLFFGKANCSACHGGTNFSDSGYHNIGIGMDAKEPDPGRFAISKLSGDTGAFKTPTLREIARTAPYMHDGSLATLEDVVDHYDKGGIQNEYLDEEMFELRLTPVEKAALVTFMKEGLSSPDYPDHKAPELPE
jgi:cytochrome c peroxidase